MALVSVTMNYGQRMVSPLYARNKRILNIGNSPTRPRQGRPVDRESMTSVLGYADGSLLVSSKVSYSN